MLVVGLIWVVIVCCVLFGIGEGFVLLVVMYVIYKWFFDMWCNLFVVLLY